MSDMAMVPVGQPVNPPGVPNFLKPGAPTAAPFTIPKAAGDTLMQPLMEAAGAASATPPPPLGLINAPGPSGPNVKNAASPLNFLKALNPRILESPNFNVKQVTGGTNTGLAAETRTKANSVHMDYSLTYKDPLDIFVGKLLACETLDCFLHMLGHYSISFRAENQKMKDLLNKLVEELVKDVTGKSAKNVSILSVLLSTPLGANLLKEAKTAELAKNPVFIAAKDIVGKKSFSTVFKVPERNQPVGVKLFPSPQPTSKPRGATGAATGARRPQATGRTGAGPNYEHADAGGGGDCFFLAVHAAAKTHPFPRVYETFQNLVGITDAMRSDEAKADQLRKWYTDRMKEEMPENKDIKKNVFESNILTMRLPLSLMNDPTTGKRFEPDIFTEFLFANNGNIRTLESEGATPETLQQMRTLQGTIAAYLPGDIRQRVYAQFNMRGNPLSDIEAQQIFDMLQIVGNNKKSSRERSNAFWHARAIALAKKGSWADSFDVTMMKNLLTPNNILLEMITAMPTNLSILTPQKKGDGTNINKRDLKLIVLDAIYIYFNQVGAQNHFTYFKWIGGEIADPEATASAAAKGSGNKGNGSARGTGNAAGNGNRSATGRNKPSTAAEEAAAGAPVAEPAAAGAPEAETEAAGAPEAEVGKIGKDPKTDWVEIVFNRSSPLSNYGIEPKRNGLSKENFENEELGYGLVYDPFKKEWKTNNEIEGPSPFYRFYPNIVRTYNLAESPYLLAIINFDSVDAQSESPDQKLYYTENDPTTIEEKSRSLTTLNAETAFFTFNPTKFPTQGGGRRNFTYKKSHAGKSRRQKYTRAHRKS